MTKETIDHIARQITGLLQWLTPEEEWLVMERVSEIQRNKKEKKL